MSDPYDWLPATRSDHREVMKTLSRLSKKLDGVLTVSSRTEVALMATQADVNDLAAQVSAQADRVNSAVANVQADIDRIEAELNVDLTPLRDSLGQVSSAADGLQSLADSNPEPTPAPEPAPVDPNV